MLYSFDYFTSLLRKLRAAFSAVAFLLMAPKLPAARGTNGHLFVPGGGVALVLELPI
jgi:ABC-type Co2+ transport system permease subunit